MAQEYINLEQTAEMLKITPGEVNRMREKSQIRAFRDGSNWKFRKEDVETALAEIIKKKNQAESAEEEAEEDLFGFGEEEGDELPTMMVDSQTVEDFSEAPIISEENTLEDDLLVLEEDADDLALMIEDSDSRGLNQIDLAGEPGPMLEEEDDNLVLGGGSDLSLSSDSGLSLADEEGTDFSLEDGDNVLELDEDSDILALDDSQELPTMLSDEETGGFDLVADADDDLDSSSQVISLDDEGDEFGSLGSADFADADFGAAPVGVGAMDFGAGSPGTDSVSLDTAEFAAKPAPAQQQVYNAYYGKLEIASMVACIVFLGLAGLMMQDLVRNMWSWNQATILSSPIMETIAGIVGLR